MPGPKPKLEVATPVTSNFPSEITSAASAVSATTATPLSGLLAVSFKAEPDFIKTPISPPMAYTDFLSKAMSLNSPVVAAPETTTALASASASASASIAKEKADDSCANSDASTSSDASTGSASVKDQQSPSTSPATSAASSSKPSPPVSATTTPSASEKASAVERALASASASLVPPSPFSKAPMSAPATGPTSFPSFKLPPSPAMSNLDSPMSAVSSMFSPYSGRSSHSVFDWDAALKAHYADQKRTKSARTSVRHIREVVTRTVTYTPRMEPAPRGKRRKVE